jgi:hypothetical protein
MMEIYFFPKKEKWWGVLSDELESGERSQISWIGKVERSPLAGKK